MIGFSDCLTRIQQLAAEGVEYENNINQTLPLRTKLKLYNFMMVYYNRMKSDGVYDQFQDNELQLSRMMHQRNIQQDHDGSLRREARNWARYYIYNELFRRHLQAPFQRYCQLQFDSTGLRRLRKRQKLERMQRQGCTEEEIRSHPFYYIEKEISDNEALPPEEQPKIYKWPLLSAEEEEALMERYCSY